MSKVRDILPNGRRPEARGQIAINVQIVDAPQIMGLQIGRSCVLLTFSGISDMPNFQLIGMPSLDSEIQARQAVFLKALMEAAARAMA